MHPIAALQSEYSLWTRDPEGGVLAACRELGIGLVAYSPLGRGFLTGRIRSENDLEPGDFRLNTPRFQGEHLQKNLGAGRRRRGRRTREGLHAGTAGARLGPRPGRDVVPIAGTKRRTYLEENLAALDVHLDGLDLARLDEVAPRGAGSGDRYPQAR